MLKAVDEIWKGMIETHTDGPEHTVHLNVTFVSNKFWFICSRIVRYSHSCLSTHTVHWHSLVEWSIVQTIGKQCSMIMAHMCVPGFTCLYRALHIINKSNLRKIYKHYQPLLLFTYYQLL